MEESTKESEPLTLEMFNHEYVKANENGDLILFHYSDRCVWDSAWDPVTRAARGIIFNRRSGELLARPWPKFFNLGEAKETKLDQLEKLGWFIVTEKVDGSLGILYQHEEQYLISTKGSLSSEQAKWGTAWLNEHADLSGVDNDYTYLFEIVYPENRVVIDYKGFRGLVLLGAVRKSDGIEMPYLKLLQAATDMNVKCVESHSFRQLSDIVSFCESLPASREGFVITFNNGLKVKVKGKEYLKLHKLTSSLTLKTFWEQWDVGKQCIPKEFLYAIPEEFRKLSDSLAVTIEKEHQNKYMQIRGEFDSITCKENIKEFAICCQKYHQENMPVLISMFKEEDNKVWNQIHKRVEHKGGEGGIT